MTLPLSHLTLESAHVADRKAEGLRSGAEDTALKAQDRLIARAVCHRLNKFDAWQ